MRRRDFIKVIGSTAAWPFAATAQQPEGMRHIGVLMGYAESDQEGQAFAAAFREELSKKFGWADGRNVRIDTRWAAPNDTELRLQFAKELVALHPDLVLSHGTPSTAALLKQTRTLPIIFVTVSDPIGSGFVTSFASPGGTVTGFVTMEPTMAEKWVELLKEIATGDQSQFRFTCSILERRPMPNFSWTRSRPPLRPSQSRRSQQGSAMPPSLKPRSQRGRIFCAGPIRS